MLLFSTLERRLLTSAIVFFSSPKQTLPPIPPPDLSEERAAQREQARKKEVIAQKGMGRGRHNVAGRRIALARQQAKFGEDTGTFGASNALGLQTSG